VRRRTCSGLSAASVLLAVIACATGCNAPSNANVLLQLPQFSGAGIAGFRDPKATLDVVDAKGDALVVDVDTGDKIETVKSPLPMACEANACAVSLKLHASEAQFRLSLETADACAKPAPDAACTPDVLHVR